MTTRNRIQSLCLVLGDKIIYITSHNTYNFVKASTNEVYWLSGPLETQQENKCFDNQQCMVLKTQQENKCFNNQYFNDNGE
jgi:two-component SAPR family response regulator